MTAVSAEPVLPADFSGSGIMAEETSSLATRYDPKPVEEKWYRHWESRGYFHARPEAAASRSASSSRRPTSPARCTWATR